MEQPNGIVKKNAPVKAISNDFGLSRCDPDKSENRPQQDGNYQICSIDPSGDNFLQIDDRLLQDGSKLFSLCSDASPHLRGVLYIETSLKKLHRFSFSSLRK